MQTFRRLTALLLTLIAWTAQAQVTTSPVFFTDTTPVTITYDATQGNGALANFTGNVYIWTGTVTNLSSSNTNWRNVHNSNLGFGVADPSALMTRSASNPNIYTITFTPRTFYPIPAAETLLRLGMIFKNADGSTVGRATGGGDIFVDAATAGLSARITNPTSNASGNPTFVALGAQISVTGTASASANLAFSLNGTQVAQQASATTLTTTVTAASGRNVVRFTATNGTNQGVDSLIFVVRPTVTIAALPAGAKDGVTYLNGGTSVILNITAPNKQFAYAIGEFNNWQTTDASYMNKTPDGNRWWVQINGLTAGREYAYQYLVDGTLRVADPYSEKILDPNDDQYIPAATYPNLKAYPTGRTTGIVSVLQTSQAPYVWTATNFQRPSRTNLVVYELLMRDFIARHDFQTLRDTLNYISRLGVNAIELMPINEFDGNDNWGYSPDFFFAPDKYYGTKQAFKQFIDECHRRGIAVILDMVLNHSTGQSPMVQLYADANGGPSASNPWFNQTAPHPYSVYNDFNHESTLTRYFSKQVMSFWLQEYHIDGYRFDLAGGFTQQPSTGNTYGNYDQSRINIWLDYYQHLIGVDANLYPILEHFPENREAKTLADAGFMIWGNAVNNYNEATMGYLPGSNFSYGYYGSTAQGGRGWNSPNLVTYMESHDEERLMYKNLTFGNSAGTYTTRDLNTALARIELASAFFFTVPGPKMVWQFGELGYDKSIFQCTNGTVPTPYGNDQCKLSAKQPVWNYYQNANRRQLYDVQRALIALKKQEPAFANPTSYTQQLAGAAKSIHVSNATQNITVIGNFDVTSTTIDPAFQRTGKWYNYLSGDSITVTNANALITLQPGAYAVYTTRRLRKATLLATKASRTDALRLVAVPNPSSSTASLQYELATPAAVTVTVHNVLGATVRTISSRTTQAVGAHELTLPVQDLTNGIYVVRLSTGQLTQTTRLVVQH